MDSVRFGRALGFGARAAAKTLVSAVDAASAPSPRQPASQQAAQSQTSRPAAQVSVDQVQRVAAQAAEASANLGRSGRQLGRSVWNPFVRLSGVLWLEFTGVFFGIFAVYAASGAWKLRAEMRETAANHDAHVHFLMSAVMAVVFAYFCVTSFLRARRKGRAQ